MGSDMTDVMYGMHLEELRDEYVSALEQFANSRSLDDFKENIKKLKDAANEWGPEGLNGTEGLEKAIEQIATLEKIYDEQLQAKTTSDKRYKIGTILTVVGLILTITGLVLAAGAIK